MSEGRRGEKNNCRWGEGLVRVGVCFWLISGVWGYFCTSAFMQCDHELRRLKRRRMPRIKRKRAGMVGVDVLWGGVAQRLSLSGCISDILFVVILTCLVFVFLFLCHLTRFTRCVRIIRSIMVVPHLVHDHPSSFLFPFLFRFPRQRAPLPPHSIHQSSIK